MVKTISISECTKCGKIWDDDGCRVALGYGQYEVDYFICDTCSYIDDAEV